MRLDEMKEGEKAAVTEIGLTGIMKRRLGELGLTENAEVECVGESPLGDPKAYLVRGAVIALRKNDGKKITVSEAAKK